MLNTEVTLKSFTFRDVLISDILPLILFCKIFKFQFILAENCYTAKYGAIAQSASFSCTLVKTNKKRTRSSNLTFLLLDLWFDKLTDWWLFKDRVHRNVFDSHNSIQSGCVYSSHTHHMSVNFRLPKFKWPSEMAPTCQD